MCLSTHSLGVLPVSGDASRTFTGVYVTGASMKSTVQFLDAVRVRHGLTSDYQLAKFLRARQQTISRYRNGQSMMDEAMCLKIAAALSLDDPSAVLVALALAGSLHNPFRGAVQPAVDQTTHMRQRRRRYGAVAREWGFQALSICVRGAAPTLGLGALAGCAGLPAAEPWSKADVGREIAFGALLAVDWAQTREIAAHPERYHERNPVIGEHPSSGRVDAYMLAAGALHLGIANLLSGDWRSAWQWGGIVIEAGAIGSNYLIGIGVPF